MHSHLHLLLLLLISTLCSTTVQAVCQNGLLYPGETFDSYYYCAKGELIPSSCPAGTYFDTSYLVCRHGTPPTQTSPTDTGGSTTGICQKPGMAADLTDCNRYYFCQAKGAALQQGNCGTGEIFDSAKYYCVRGSC